MLTIPTVWRRVLDALQRPFPESFIGGGALRDLDNDRPIKDVDVFIGEHENIGDKLVDALRPMGFVVQDVSLVDASSAGSTVQQVFEATHLVEVCPPLNIIVAGERESAGGFMQWHLDRFDIGLCRIAYDGSKVEYTSSYCVDKAERRLTVMHAHTIERTMQRLQRISEKYRGWRLINVDGTEIPRDSDRFDEFRF